MINPIIFVKFVNFSEENPETGGDVLQNDECKQKSDHSFKAGAYFQNVGNMLNELILNSYYLYQSCKFGKTHKLIYLSNSSETSQFVYISFLNECIEWDHRYEIYDEPRCQVM